MSTNMHIGPETGKDEKAPYMFYQHLSFLVTTSSTNNMFKY